MSKFRGQYMDIVHPSSNVRILDKQNYVNEQSSEKEPIESTENLSEPESDKNDISSQEAIVEPENTSNELEFIDIDDEPKTDTYNTPFLPDVGVKKRPLGGLLPAESPEQSFDNIDKDKNSFDINELIDLRQLELPADDGGRGELELSLPAGDSAEDANTTQKSISEEPKEKAKISNKIDYPLRTNVSEPPKFDTRIALANTMTASQYEASGIAQPTEMSSPFAHASDAAGQNSAKKSLPVWSWILIFVLIAIAGMAAGALIYLSGWLG